MPTPVKDEVQAILSIHNRAGRLNRTMQEAWEAYKLNPDRGWFRRKSTRAALVWEHTIRLATQYFADDAGVKIVEHHDTVSFIFDDQVLIRFKKGSTEMMTSNVPTLLSEAYNDHEQDLFGHEGHQRVQAIYILNRLETSIMWAGIVAHNINKRPMWELNLSGIAPQTEMLPFVHHQPEQKPASALAKLKASAQPVEKDKAANDNE